MGVFLRGLFLNLLVWLPVLVAVLVVLFWMQRGCASLDVPLAPPNPALDWPEPVCCEPCTGAECPVEAPEDRKLSDWPLFPALLLSLGLVGIFLVVCIVYSLALRKGGKESWSRYGARRLFEMAAHWWLVVTVGLLLLGSLPVVARAVGAQAAIEGSVVSILLGLFSGLASFFQAGRNGGGKKSRVPLGLIATVGALLLLYGVLFLAYRLAFFYFEFPSPESLAHPVVWRWILLGALGVAGVTGYFVNLNYIGLHRFYRDRLMETFMPQVGAALADQTGPTRAGDAILMSEMKGENQRGPYHLVDTNVVLVDSGTRKFRMRGGDSFILSPCYCGGTATGYLPTQAFMKDQMTLATAMAISGAAANPNTGAGGTGPTRAKAVSLLMALLNVRLGYWIPSPKRKSQRARTPSHFRAMLYEVVPSGYRETKPYLQISDGGHFENLALYELVRRKCRVILVLDGAADPGFAFGDLQVVTRRIAADFGALIEWDEDRAFEDMIPKHDGDYPQGVKVADRGHALATIRYASGGTSTLVYMKSTMIRELSLRVRGYKSSHETFPDQSTTDQFFDEEQFEAYRDLGYQLATRLVKDRAVSLAEHIRCAQGA
jgi:hypothetical protein